MNILAEISFPDSGMRYIAKERIVYGGKQYTKHIESVSEISDNMGWEKGYEDNIITITILDTLLTREFRDKLLDAEDKYIANVQVVLRIDDGTLLATQKVKQWGFPPGLWVINISNAIDMTRDFTEKINTTTWVNAHDDAIGQVVPMAYNTVDNIKAWKIDDRTNFGDWLLGKAPISTITKVVIDGETIGGAYYSLGNDGTYYWLNMGHGVIMLKGNYCYVSVTTAAYTPVEIAKHLLDTIYGAVGVAANADFKTFLSNQSYGAADIRFLLDSTRTAADFLKAFCESFECNYYLNASNEVVFTWIDRSNPTIAKEFSETEMLSITKSRDYDPTSIKNHIKYWYDKNYEDGSYNSFVIADNSDNWGEYLDEIQFEFLGESVQAGVTATERYQLNKEPFSVWQGRCLYSVGKDVNNGDLVKVTSPDLVTRNPTCFMVIRKRINPETGEILFDLVERNYLDETFYCLNEDGAFARGEQGYKIIND